MQLFKSLWNKRLVKILTAILLFCGTERFCRMQTEGFQVIKTRAVLDYHPGWDNAPLSFHEQEEIDHILSQPFYFLGSGVQSYAFISKDRKTVLKLFKHYHMWPHTQLLKELSLPFGFDHLREKVIQERQRRVSFIFDSSKIAYEKCLEETGVFYLHLNASSTFKRSLTIFDKLGIQHELELDNTPFILQKKAEPILSRISELMKKKKEEEAKKCISTFLHLIYHRCQKGILNTDRKICRNIGYVEDQAIHIDIGSFMQFTASPTPQSIHDEVVRETLEFKEWLRKKHPGLVESFNQNMQELFSNEP